MAKIDKSQARLLGFAPTAGLDALVTAMNAVPGPKVQVLLPAGQTSDPERDAPPFDAPRSQPTSWPGLSGPPPQPTAPTGGPNKPSHDDDDAPLGITAPSTGIAALFQPEPPETLLSRARDTLAAGLLTVQRRLEIGCQAGPFLAMNPAAACCTTTDLPRLLATEWPALTAALAHHGAHQQWDIALKWDPKDVVARHRAEIAPVAALGHQALAGAVGGVLQRERDKLETALLTALRPTVIEFAPGGAACTDASVTVTVLVEAGGEAAVEAALEAMEPAGGVSIDMRGPLPPLSFAAVRIALADEQAVTAAWRTLGLANRIDLADLHQQWRLRAAKVHPDRGPAKHDVSVSGLTEAYRLLRGLLPPGTDASLAELLGRAGPRLLLPEIAAPETARMPELTA